MDRRALEAARAWAEHGLIEPEQLAAIEAHEAQIPREEPWTATALFALGGTLVAGAAFAFTLLLGLHGTQGAAFQLVVGGLLGAGAGVAWKLKAPPGAVDGFVIAALLCLVIGGAPGEIPYTSLLPLFGGLLATGLRPERAVASTAGAMATLTAIPFLLFLELQPEQHLQTVITTMWFGLTAGYGALALAAARRWPKFNEHGPLAAATIGYVVAAIAFTITVIEPGFRGGEEVVVALLLVPVGLAGYLLRAPSILSIAILAFAIDAIIFSFDVGGQVVGVVTLLLTAGAMVALALFARR